MIHLNIICQHCQELFTYESQRTKPRAFCTELCRQRANYAAKPEYYRAASRKSAAKHKKPATVYRFESECTHCGVAFCHASKRNKPNRYCSAECRKARYYADNLEACIERARNQKSAPDYAEKQRAYYDANRDVIAARAKAHREANAGLVSERKAAYYWANRDARLAYWHEWASNPENRLSTRENTREWAKNNPEKVRAHQANRRARLRAAAVETFDPHEVFDRDNWICQLCAEPVDPLLKFPDVMSKSLDHVIPLSKGGEHSRGNAQLAHFGCNASKNDKMPGEYTGTRSYA